VKLPHAGVLGGIRQRAGLSVAIAAVATVAAAAATIGPAYDAAARASILADNLHDQNPVATSVQATGSGPTAGLADTLALQVNQALAGHLGGQATLRRLFGPPVEAVLAQVSTGGHQSPLTWRTGFCGHLKIVAGTCPATADQVLVSVSFARESHLKPGDVAGLPPGYGKLIVTGEYAVPSVPELNGDPYWLSALCDDFTFEDPCPTSGPGGSGGAAWDAVFTPAATFAAAPAAEQGTALVIDALSPASVRPGDIGLLGGAVSELTADTSLLQANISAVSSIPQLAGQVTSDWQTLDVPVFLIAAQLLLLAWLLLFLIAADAAEARAPEVALAKLRGFGPLRTVVFGLSETALLIVAAFPAGALAGWAATAGLARILLRPGTPVGLTWLAVAAAAVSTAGGLAAVLAAARGALTRPVTEQWRRTARDGARRGWLLDAVLAIAAVAGLAELLLSGDVSATRSGSLSLLVPGLLGLAVAVVASRLLPAGCALLFRVTRRGGGTGLFLAVRHIARRPGATRTTIVLVASFTLATFAVTAYAVEIQNVDRVAAAQAGAAAVLTVTPPDGQDLAAIVDKVDPGGRRAAAVDRYEGTAANGSVLLAVQPQRFARVAAWQPGFFAGSTGTLAAALQPPAAPPVTLPAGTTAVRVRISGLSGAPPVTKLTFWMTEQAGGSGGQTPVSLGPLRDGVLSAQLSQCPCDITMVSLDAADASASTYQGKLSLSGLAGQAGRGPWVTVPQALASAAGWKAGAEFASGCGSPGAVTAAAGSFQWEFTGTGACGPALHRQDTPALLPALVASGLAAGTGGTLVTQGLDGQELDVFPVAVAAAVPGVPASGVVVDRTYALRAAYYTEGSLGDEEVWTAPGALGAVQAGLTRAGVTIDSVVTQAGARSVLLRQGPGLASVLFLAAAIAAALLAGGAAVLALYQAGRRRRHEYAALLAGRVPRRSLRSSVLIEQAVVLGFGAAAGIATGIGSAVLVLRDIPEFASPPPAPPLIFSPPAAPVLIPLFVTVAVLAAAAVLGALAVIRSARPELLRQGQG
jgi:hypothetical protein